MKFRTLALIVALLAAAGCGSSNSAAPAPATNQESQTAATKTAPAATRTRTSAATRTSRVPGGLTITSEPNPKDPGAAPIQYVTGKVMIVFSKSSSAAERQAALATAGVKLERPVDKLGIGVGLVDAGQERAAARSLRQQPGVKDAGPDFVASAAG